MKSSVFLCVFRAAILVLLLLSCCFNDAFAYICNVEKAGPITVTVEKIEKITQLQTPREVKVSVKNDAETAITLRLKASSLESVVLIGESEREITVPAKSESETVFQVLAKSGTYSAHYPVHLYGEFSYEGKTVTLHPVQVVQTELGTLGMIPQIVGKNALGQDVKVGELIENADELPILTVPQDAGLFLPQTKAYRVLWNYDNDNGNEKDKTHVLPIGFFGSDEISSASFSVYDTNRGGVSRDAFSVHPPWKGGPGTMFTEYRLKLPQSKTIRFSFYGGLRDLHPGEPPSDGMTYRVWVDEEIVHSVHIAERQWVPVEVDLTKFAGKTVLFRLESDPGPARDTTCDSGFWGDPLISCAEKPKTLTPEEKTQLFAENLEAIKTGKSPNAKRTFFIALAASSENAPHAVVSLGENGLLDGVIGFGNEKSQVQYDGLRVWIEGQRLGGESSAIVCEKPAVVPMLGPLSNGVLIEQKIHVGERELLMTYEIGRACPGLKLEVRCSDPDAISRIEFGPTTKHAEKVYFGHGYCIEEPEAFQITNGGHTLSTSHVGFDFEGGISLLMATSFPPEKIVVDPNSKTYTLNVYPNTTFTFVPGLKGAMDCAIRYRPLYDKDAAPGVTKKAGRFAFDWWGGTFTDQAKKIQEHVDYGITDALVVAHNWQRWGYDNRLPDIWPPNPRVGSVEEVQAVIALCRQHGILYGLHDNYIDIYPDADDFSYDLVSFEKRGEPRKAWNNYGIDAQSYQFRPDRILPFIDRNFAAMSPHIKQSTYFVDVFSSINVMDFWDRDGTFHSRRETLDCWCKSFDLIREKLGDDLPTISEAGSDFLIGHLDGADCQFLTLSEHSGDFRIQIKCKNWSRVPWFDAVNHTRFSLHGVGYDSRYAANRGYDLHGYGSDDVISTEVLTAHAMQVGYNTPLRDAVRKYWLAQPLIRSLADQEIESVEFHEGNINRLVIKWTGGTVIFVNQGTDNWAFEDRDTIYPAFMLDATIPPYGYIAHGPFGISGIFSTRNGIVEFSHEKKSGDSYFNPRTHVTKKYLPTIPIAEEFKYHGEDRFSLDVNWKMFRPMSKLENVKDYEWFLHLEEPKYAWYHRPKERPISGGKPAISVSKWDSDQKISTGALRFPSDLAPGTYNVLIGLWDAQGDKSRAAILGLTPDNSRVQLGRLTVEKRGDTITNLVFNPTKEDPPELFERLLPNEATLIGEEYPVNGAFRMVVEYNNTLIITPLPGEPEFEVQVFLLPTWQKVGKGRFSVIAVDRTGSHLRDVPFEIRSGTPVFKTKEGEFSYCVTFGKK